MNSRNIFQLTFIALTAFAPNLQAASVGLADWCVNLNGNISVACNGGGAGNMAISLSSFDQTLETGNNNLGSIGVTLAPGLNQYVSFYADYDVNFATFGSFDDSASVHGTRPAGVSYSLEDPNVSNIFNDFAGNTLNNMNTVGTPAGPPNNCCDVSFALAVSNINIAAGGSGLVSFVVGTVVPTSGFYIQQTNQNTLQSIYLQENVTINTPITGSPEPSEALALVLSLSGLAIAYRRRAVGASIFHNRKPEVL